jgi:zinc/manganese transport system permease protein
VEQLIQSQLFWNALAGGTMAAVVAGLVGYFLVLRALAFASEALVDISFAGATGGALLGFGPIFGMLGLGAAAVAVLGLLSDRVRGRDIEVGVILSFALGLGVLFLGLYAHSSGGHASAGGSILFGSLMTIRSSDTMVCAGMSLAVLLTLAVIGRPLLFSSVDPAAARAKGVPLTAVNLSFLALLACTTILCVMSVGVLLAVSLLLAPAASAVHLSRRPAMTLTLSAVFGIVSVWTGVGLEFFGPWRHVPIGFFVVTAASFLYVITLVIQRFRGRGRGREPYPTPEVRVRETQDWRK